MRVRRWMSRTNDGFGRPEGVQAGTKEAQRGLEGKEGGGEGEKGEKAAYIKTRLLDLLQNG